MNRRDLFRGVAGLAVAAVVPAPVNPYHGWWNDELVPMTEEAKLTMWSDILKAVHESPDLQALYSTKKIAAHMTSILTASPGWPRLP